ncbi:MAG TPA: hypothetical protein PK041_01765 [Kaistella sp.]|nr:hypothetical protein [Kaistella sp.]
MRIITFLVCLLMAQMAFSQIEKKNMTSGEMTLVNNDKILFKDLTWKNDKAFYINANNNQAEELFDASIKTIEEKEITIAAPLANVPTKNEEKKITSSSFGYPTGVYKTKGDFISKTPSSNPQISKRGLIGFEKPLVGDDENYCFFYDTSDSKLKNVFAVVHNGYLYFNIAAILVNRNKNDRAQTSDFPNSYTKVIFGGENYLYTEADLANVWAKGLAYSAGAAGGAVASTLNTGKGIVWDFKNQEFNIFKNCTDYNDFIKDKSAEDVQKCENQQPNNLQVREAVMKIK